MPTPAKCNADSPGRFMAASRSSTRAEAKTRTKALAMPPAKRSRRKAGTVLTSPMAAVDSALPASAAMNQPRLPPGRNGLAAASAPSR